jgi:phage I-like protein
MKKLLAKRLELHTLTLELTDDKPPTEIRLFAFGKNKTLKGEFILDDAGAKDIMDFYEEHGIELSFDYEHAALSDPPGEAPAAGWYKLEKREDGLWATGIKWTKKATEYLENREYRFFSPAFVTDAGKRITRIINAALTNIPATINQKPLMALVGLGMSFDQVHRDLNLAIRQAFNDAWIVEVFTDSVVFEHHGKLFSVSYHLEGEKVMLDGEAVEVQKTYVPREEGETMKTVLARLGLTQDATEATALSAVEKLQEGNGLIQKLSGLVGEGKDVLATVLAWKDGAAQTETLSAKVAELEGKDRDTKITALFAKGKADGKVTPASEAALRVALSDDKGVISPEKLETYLNAAPKIQALADDKVAEKASASKSYKDMSYAERAALYESDKALWTKLRDEHLNVQN